MSHLEQFYVRPENVAEETFILDGSEYTHAVRVLRKQSGDWLVAVDGAGHRYGGPITAIERHFLRVAVRTREEESGEPRLRVVLAQAVPKGGAFDWIVEKGTEIGIAEFQPMQTGRSVAAPQGREGRWLDKARAAMKQCGRSRCPVIHPLCSWQEVLSRHGHLPVFLAHPSHQSDEVARRGILHQAGRILLLVGPEGGFTDAEIEAAKSLRAQELSLGSRRLRSETAGLVAAVRLLAEAGDLDLV